MEELSPAAIEAFVETGFVHLTGAFPRATAAAGCEILWRMAGVDPADPSTWTRPVIRLDGSGAPPFAEAANTPRLVRACDQLAGAGRWLPRFGLGTFPLRFPHPADPGDCGWHIDASFMLPGEAEYRINVRSRGRALLMLFLFTDVGPDDAPTRIRPGSHLDVPPVLAAAGEEGWPFMEACRRLDAAGALDSPRRPVALATGEAGDVYLCHPFLVHAAQVHRGRRPRAIAQPPLDARAPLDLERAEGACSPVERAVRRALGR